jgi:hypothetical protein
MFYVHSFGKTYGPRGRPVLGLKRQQGTVSRFVQISWQTEKTSALKVKSVNFCSQRDSMKSRGILVNYRTGTDTPVRGALWCKTIAIPL